MSEKMTHVAHNFDELVEFAVEYLQTQLSDHNGTLGAMNISKFRIAAANFLLNQEPYKILEVASTSKNAAKDMLEAVANFLTSSSSFSPEALEAIAYLLTNYDDYSRNTADETRFERNIINIHIIVVLISLRDTYGIRPSRNNVTSDKISGCDIVAAAVVSLGLAGPRSFESVKHVWVNRKYYFHEFIHGPYSDEKLEELLFGSYEGFLTTFSLADAKMGRGVRVQTKPK